MFADVAAEVDVELARHVAPEDGGPADDQGPEVAPVPPPPAPPVPWQAVAQTAAPAAPRSAKRSSAAKVAALVAAAVLVVGGGVGAALALSGGDEEAGEDPPTTPSSVVTTTPVTVSETTTTTAEPEDPPFTFGDDPALDALTDGCTAGDLAACDQLYVDSPLSSDYELYGDTCGARTTVLSFAGECSVAFVDGYTSAVDGCTAGDMNACDFLYGDSAFGSVYETYGASCGGRTTTPSNGQCTLLFSV